MSEQSKIDAERAAFEAFHIAECKRLGMTDPDDLASEFDRDSKGNYIYIAAETGWRAWQAHASLPVGVPDGLFLGDALLMWNRRHDNPPIKVGCEYGVADALLQIMAAPAAPTVKAEQVQCDTCEDAGVFAVDGSGPFDCYKCGKKAAAQTASESAGGLAIAGLQGAAQAPSLPAAGSAVEEVEVVGYRIYWPAVGTEPAKARTVDPSEYESKKPVFHTCVEPLMTVAQHERIVAAISSQQSAPKFCCSLSYKAAKQAAWGKRDLARCKCDHNEYCEHCWPDDFREGGKWHGRFEQQSAPERVSVPRELLERLVRATGTVYQMASGAKSVMAPEYAKTHDEGRALLASHAECGKV